MAYLLFSEGDDIMAALFSQVQNRKGRGKGVNKEEGKGDRVSKGKRES